jgi:hypothetical protein
METRIVAVFSLLAGILTACSGGKPFPTALAASSASASPASTPSSTPTNTPTLTPTPWISPTPKTLYGYPTPQSPAPLPTCDPTKDCWPPWKVDIQRQNLALHELYLDKYVLRSWCDVNSPSINISCAVTISSRGNTQIELWGYPAEFGPETGADLTGRGKPDIVIVSFSQGNCCIETIVYEAGDTLKKILDIGSEQPGMFVDLNGDGIDEFVFKTDRRFSQVCSNCTVWAPHVYEYRSGSGYVPATYKFKDLLTNDIQVRMDSLSQFMKQNPNLTLHFPDFGYLDFRATQTVEDQEYQQNEAQNADYQWAVNDLYNLVVLYLLAGEPAEAQKILSQYFPPEKVSQYLVAIRADVRDWLAP